MIDNDDDDDDNDVKSEQSMRWKRNIMSASSINVL
jgi:hypothetical protein